MNRYHNNALMDALTVIKDNAMFAILILSLITQPMSVIVSLSTKTIFTSILTAMAQL